HRCQNPLGYHVALGLALHFQRLVFTSEARPFAIHTSPHRQRSTFRTVPRKPSMDLANVILKLATRYLRPLAARTALQRQRHWPRIRHLRRRKFRLPEIWAFIEKSYAVSVQFSLRGDLPYHADYGLAVGLFYSQNKLLLRCKSVGRDDSCAMQAQHHRVCSLREG